MFGMTIEDWANWATVLAVFGAPVLGLIWWCWTRRQRRQLVNDISKDLQEISRIAHEGIEQQLAIVTHSDSSETARIEAKVSIATLYLAVLHNCSVANIVLTHREASLLPGWKLQWPIAPKYTP